MYKEVNDFINSRTDSDLAMLCNDIYDWHSTGSLSKDSSLYKVSKDFTCPNADYVAELVMNRSAERFEKVVLLLFGKMPYKFLRSTSDK